ncbi:hypothetical protein GY45DRAFT_1331411 [Cubamyces sp. BRFM 1775]|nr:hypothetical protein GY45DRAFT_1331411 [Cubamyces sp. BRFM 1775]
MSVSHGVYNVPMALNPELSCTQGLEPGLAMARVKKHVSDSYKHTLGPMPLESFLQEFLPNTSVDPKGCLSSRNAFVGIPPHTHDRSRISQPLIAALNKKTKFKARCPGFVFLDTAKRSIRQSRLGYAKPDICCYTTDYAKIVRKADRSSRADLGYADLYIQVNTSPTDDIFVDPPIGATTEHELLRELEDESATEDAEPLSDAARVWGLNVSFATEILSRQQRLFLFSISLFGSFARIYRWDRAGCIVSRAFDVRQHSHLLTEFLWRYSTLSDAGRGFDMSVRMATSAQENLFRDAITKHVAIQLEVAGEELDKAVSAHYQPSHVSLVDVHSQDTSPTESKVRQFLVSRPTVSPLYLEGRSTRGYWAVDTSTGAVAFLKDTWRLSASYELEGDILRNLNKLGVRNVPVVAVYGDVLGCSPVSSGGHVTGSVQRTQTGNYQDKSWTCSIDEERVHINEYIHHRLVCSTVGYSLHHLKGTEELLHATHDAFTAMRDALAKDSRIHRDLSVGNIILVKEPGCGIRKGYLIDWEVSDRVDDAGEALHPGRTGTWAFMSIRMLSMDEEYSKHTFADDMEALVYVVLYCALLYTPHNLSINTLTRIKEKIFDDVEVFQGQTGGGDAKLANSYTRSYTSLVHFDSTALQEWINTALDHHNPRSQGLKVYKEKWTPEAVDAFWTEFLETHELERDNRRVNRVSLAAFYDWNSLSDPPALPAPVPKRARLASGSDSDERESKRIRAVAEKALSEPHHPAERNANDPDVPTSSSPTRQSARIRARSALSESTTRPSRGPQATKAGQGRSQRVDATPARLQRESRK